MPFLREWVCNFPAYWTPEQARGYMQDTASVVNQLILPAMQALGPLHAASIVLAAVSGIARSNPVYAADIQAAMARTYDLVSQIKAAMDTPGKPN